MKKILAFILVLMVVMSSSFVTAFAQDNETEILPPTGTSTADEASADEGAQDEIEITDKAYDYILRQMNGNDLFEQEGVSYSLNVISMNESYALVDLNFAEKTEDALCWQKIGDYVFFNETSRVSYCTAMGYYVVVDKREVLLLDEAFERGLQGLLENCVTAGICQRIGDVNSDNTLSVRDVTYIQKMIAGVDGYEDMYCNRISWLSGSPVSDFDGNDKVNIKDATNIQKYLADLTFDFCGEKDVTYTSIPASAYSIPCAIVKGDGLGYTESDFVNVFTSVDEYTQLFGKESDVYNSEFFENKSIIYVNKMFWSGSFDYEVRDVRLKGDTIYIDSCVIDVNPGMGVTDDIECIGMYLVVDKYRVSGVKEYKLYTDTRFNVSPDKPVFSAYVEKAYNYKDEIPSGIIRSYDEYKALYDDLRYVYNEDFFRNNDLVVMSVPMSSDRGFSVKGVYPYENILYIEAGLENHSGMAPQILTRYNVYIAVDKSIMKDITDFEIYP